ncbi:AMIN family periplasmic protein [Sulfurospirillum diekertiae]|uniref:AMIN family periplasmic protein n=1 Tax=Sulfurospirillum diekertiae TaxID=1854492 RepID=A0A290HHL4_9BACT|nr:AMIN domain-containing protein [Sulfurospirillum diekertiae]ATB70895.1 AMIN family periplasmic protein [Sulfurospirillum diekertiae]
MQKILWLFLSLAVILEARENPFETNMSPQDVGQTTQIKEERTDFVNASLTLPSSARILKSASVTFQNLDGSISEEVVGIEKNIDWHLPLILSNAKADANASSPIALPVNVPDSKKSAEKKVPAPKEEKITSLIAPNTNVEGSTFKLIDNLSFYINQNEITIFTKDTKVRDFLIADPYKVVVDFKKVNSYATKTLDFKKAPFVSATLGDHDDFYRIAILLDGHYRYDIEAFKGGYIIKLK